MRRIPHHASMATNGHDGGTDLEANPLFSAPMQLCVCVLPPEKNKRFLVRGVGEDVAEEVAVVQVAAAAVVSRQCPDRPPGASGASL